MGRMEPWQVAALDKRDVWLGAPEVMGWSFCRGTKFLPLELGKEQANTSKREGWLQMVEARFFPLKQNQIIVQ